jgi:hypothetical protein
MTRSYRSVCLMCKKQVVVLDWHKKTQSRSETECEKMARFFIYVFEELAILAAKVGWFFAVLWISNVSIVFG